MADYYPLLTRAIATLPDQDLAQRQAIYRRAREALERQLRGLDPPLGEAEILKETLALEDVIRRIEADFAELPPIPASEAEPVLEAAPAKEMPGPAEAKADAPVAAPIASTVEKSDRPAPEPTPEAAVAIKPARSRQSDRPKAETRQEVEKGRRKLGLYAVLGGLAMLAMGAFAYLNREDPALYRSGGQPVAEAPRAIEPSEQAKREGRLGATPDSPAPPPAPRQEPPRVEPQRNASTTPATPPSGTTVLPVTSRAFMVLEVPGGAPNQFEGQANWSFAPDPASRSGDRAIRSVINYTGAGLTIDFSIARNRDPQVNSSHIIFVSFDTKDPALAVREMSAIEWRERESQTGSAMAGVLVPIQDNVFLIGLEKADAAVERNLELLRTQRWLVFEVRLANGRRGAFLVEKGSAGDKAVADALAAWK
jgi:hypothetical protein